MKRSLLVSLLVLLCIATVTACGSNSSTNAIKSTKGASNASPTSTGSAVQKQTVQVTLVEYKITSSITTFHVGVPYHFVVTNKGTIPHEFMVMPPMGDNVSMASMDSAALVFIPIIAPDQTSTIDYTFTKPDAQLEIACHFTGRQASDSHYALGMHLSIIVE
jgi:uncharacterized cupredoxin-like copper-binding protein